MVEYKTYPNISDLNLSGNPITSLWLYGDDIMGGWASPMFLIILGIISYLAVYEAIPGRGHSAMLASGFVTFITSFLMMGAGVLHPFWFFGSTVYVIIGIIISSKDGRVD